jgi:hypothetical protein
MFVTGTHQNEARIYGIRFFIRGKPWVVTVDNYLPFSYSSGSGYALRGVDPKGASSAMWAPILEKAWAKVKGGYEDAEGGFIQTGLRSLLGCPIFSYGVASIGTSDGPADLDEVWSMLSSADASDYPMGAGTAGTSDAYTNACGIAQRHAYSVMATF